MKLSRHLAACLVLIVPLCAPPVAAASSAASAPADGTVVEQSPCTLPFMRYAEWLGFIRQRRSAAGVAFDEAAFRAGHPREAFDALAVRRSVDCRHIVYLSDGLRIAGFVVAPRGAAAQPRPLIIFNRGGNRAFGQLVLADLVDFAQWAQQGFVVVASQYRGGPGSEGADEFGGADVDDVMNLFAVARNLGGADLRNVFMLGVSRGGLMTFQALKHGAAVNAAAVIGAPTDLSLAADHRPEMQALYLELIPGFEQHREALLRERCALDFADHLAAPLLILHGGADDRVGPEQALELAQRLQRLGRPYELIVYAGDDHGLNQHRQDSLRRALAWFRQHMRANTSEPSR
ncbi:MAG TPA: prolyl oligopeptidase family serine peptidase [Ideonella sp.]|nr:prolyl oligopeptidase family serine peptidase [Ideonella sp.]